MGSHIFWDFGGKEILASRDFEYKKIGRFMVKNIVIVFSALVLIFNNQLA